MIPQASAALFKVAHGRDHRSRRSKFRRRFSAVAAMWADGAGIGPELAAVGTNPVASIPAVLLGVRIGCCQLDLPCEVEGAQATVTVAHDLIQGKELRVAIRPRRPFQDKQWIMSPRLFTAFDHVKTDTGQPCLLDGVTIRQAGYDDDADPFMVGTAELIELGDNDVTSRRWTAQFLGAFAPADRWRGSLAGAELSVEVVSGASERKSGALARHPRLRGLTPLVTSASWHREVLAPDYGRLLRIEVEFAERATAMKAEQYLLIHVARLLHLFSGARPTLCGLWDARERTGRLLDLGRDLMVVRRRVVANTVTLGSFLDEVAPRWGALSETDRQVVRVGVDSLSAMSPDLEPAVVTGAMTLEYLAAALLPKASNSYALTKAQRASIRSGLGALAAQVAGGSTWENDLPRIEARLFQAPAGDRIAELMAKFGVPTTPEELRAHAAVRNAVVHGRRDGTNAHEKVTAMMFQRHAAGSVLLRMVGFTGQVRDPREHHLRQVRAESRVQ